MRSKLGRSYLMRTTSGALRAVVAYSCAPSIGASIVARDLQEAPGDLITPFKPERAAA
jgi:hypothetical protein